VRTIYLLFNEGYSASDGDRLIRDVFARERCGWLRSWLGVARVVAGYARRARSVSACAAGGAGCADGTPLMLEQERRLWDQA
jgi:predicted RNA polymerase sigma factor